MTVLQTLILGILQGITEFIPISSSGHLVLAEKFLGLSPEQFFEFDVAMHGATFLALAVYFAKDWWRMAVGFLGSANNTCGSGTNSTNIGIHNAKDMSSANDAANANINKEARNLFWLLIIATVPAGLLGIFAKDFFEGMREPEMVFTLMIVTGTVFLIAEFYNKKREKREKLSYLAALVVGIAQAFALFPGISRSGATIAAGLFMRQGRVSSARFSFLLGTIAIAGAMILTVPDLIREITSSTGASDINASGINISGGDTSMIGASGIGFMHLLAGFSAAAISGYLSIKFLMKFLAKHSLNIFAAYLIVVGALGLIFG